MNAESTTDSDVYRGKFPLARLPAHDIDTILNKFLHVEWGNSNVKDIYPLLPAQEGFLFHYLSSPQNDPYLRWKKLIFKTMQEVEAYIASTNKVVARHDILRTSLFWQGISRPHQVIFYNSCVKPHELNFFDCEDVSDSFEQRYRENVYHYDVNNAPLLKLEYSYDKTNDQWIVMRITHQLITDLATEKMVEEEIQAILDSREEDLPPALEFVSFLRDIQIKNTGDSDEYFRNMVGDVDETVCFISQDRLDDDWQDVQEHSAALPNELSLAIQNIGANLGVDPPHLFHLAWALVVTRCSGQADPVFGTVVSCRSKFTERGGRLFGPLVNTLPIRMGLDRGGVLEVLNGSRRRLTGLLRHRFASLALAQRCSGVRAPAPLFTSLFNFRRNRDDAAAGDMTKLMAGIAAGYVERSNYPVTMSVDDFATSFSLTAQAKSSIGAERVCAMMTRALESLVEALASAPDSPACRLDVLPAAERERVLVAWNATEAVYPQRCIHELFEEQAALDPAAVALVLGDAQLSYGELDARANRLAHHLRRQGVGAESRVAICTERSLETIVALLAILKAGGGYVPLDPDYPTERLRYMLGDSAPVVVLCHRPTRTVAEELLAGLVSRPQLVDLDADRQAWDDLPPAPLQTSSTGPSPTSLAYIVYTSGSTGQPKGVMVEHHAIVPLVKGCDYVTLDPGTVLLCGSPLSFDASTFEIWGPLTNGGRCILVERGVLLSPAAYRSALSKHEVTTTFITTALFNQLALEDPGIWQGLEQVLFGGEDVNTAIVNAVLTTAAPRKLTHIYGPTETVTFSIAHSLSLGHASDHHIPIGRPISNMRVYVLDQWMEPVPIGTKGEIYIGGAGVARGYLNQPELTAERFIESPFVAGDRLYRTGDLARHLPDGAIEFLGRNDFQVKIRGFRIELGEIEARLAELAGVRDAVVLAREDAPGEKRLVAYYTIEEGAARQPDAEALRAHLTSSLPDYMVPAAYVAIDRLPLTPNGKLDRRALPPPEQDAYVRKGYEAPIGTVEQQLAAIWSEALKVEPISRHDNFFELGGHSLLAVRVVLSIRQVLHTDVAIADLFEKPSLAGLAETVLARRQSSVVAIPPSARGRPLPLSFAQERLWFLMRMDGAREAYHIPMALALQGELDIAVLQHAFDALLARHEALRTTFSFDGAVPVQDIGAADRKFELHIHDFEAQGISDDALDRLYAEQIGAPFDLSSGPLIRASVIRRSPADHILIIVMHHIVSDGWSLGVFNREISELYRTFRDGGQHAQSALPPLPIQYPDYAIWQREQHRSGGMDRQADYWLKTLVGAPTLLGLPTDFKRPPQQDYRGGRVPFVLDEALTAQLNALGRRHGVTMFTILLAALAVTLSRLSGEKDIVIGTPSANRGRTEIEGLIGFFVNTLALRVPVDPNATLKDVLERAKHASSAAQANQDLPFERVVELINPARSMAHTPLFQVMLAWQSDDLGALDFPGVAAEPIDLAYDVAKFDLTLTLAETAGRITGGIEYATALFEPATVERYAAYVMEVLAAFGADIDQIATRLPILPATERERVLVTWNATEAVYPQRCIHELFEEQAALAPAAVALVLGDAQLSYGELDGRANRLARHLRRQGVGAESRVVICTERSLETIVALLAILKAGGGYVPLDPDYPTERLRYMLGDSAPVVVLCHRPTRTVAEELLAGLVSRPQLVDLDADRQAWEDLPPTPPPAGETGPSPSSLAYVLYTSGSTGQPKGVEAVHRNVARLVKGADYVDLARQDVMLHLAPLAFDASTFEIWGALLNGSRLLLYPHRRVDPAQLGQVIRAGTVSTLWLTAGLFHQMVDHDLSAFDSVRQLLAGGDVLSPHHVRRVVEALPNCQLINGYGPTECVTFSACMPVLEAPPIGASVPIGRPIANTRIYILDRYREPVPIGTTGEIYIGGAGVARGYLNQPELTAERFIESPFVAGDRLYRTGDLARHLPGGAIEFLGRNDFQVKIRGFRIELGEIEARLAELAGVRDAVVLAREDAPGEKRLVAYYTVEDGAARQPDAEALRAHLVPSLPDYMVPAAYVAIDRLPLTPNGKLDRRALPSPDQDAYVRKGYEAPQGTVEEQLAAIWGEVLKVERVSRHDNFFELGGHSLLAVQLTSRINQELCDLVEVIDIFESPVFSGSADIIQTRSNSARTVVE